MAGGDPPGAVAVPQGADARLLHGCDAVGPEGGVGLDLAGDLVGLPTRAEG